MILAEEHKNTLPVTKKAKNSPQFTNLQLECANYAGNDDWIFICQHCLPVEISLPERQSQSNNNKHVNHQTIYLDSRA